MRPFRAYVEVHEENGTDDSALEESIIPDKTWIHFSIHLLSLSSVCSNSFVLRSVMFLLAIIESNVALCHAGSFGCELTILRL